MVINLRRFRRLTADETGRIWSVGSYRKDERGCYRYRVFLNNKDVTNQTFYVDSRRGVVRMLARNVEGNFYVGRDGNPVTIERRGHVRLRRLRSIA